METTVTSNWTPDNHNIIGPPQRKKPATRGFGRKSSRSATLTDRNQTQGAPEVPRVNQKHGRPNLVNSLGQALFTRESDGKLVYLECCVPGCGKTSFNTIHSLMCHVANPLSHGLKGFLQNSTHAIEVCARVAPGQDNGRDAYTNPNQATMTVDGVGSPALEGGARKVVATSDTQIDEEVNLRGVERGYRLSPTIRRSTRLKCRAEQAAETFEGLLSSDSDNESALGHYTSSGILDGCHERNNSWLKEQGVPIEGRAVEESLAVGILDPVLSKAARTVEGLLILDDTESYHIRSQDRFRTPKFSPINPAASPPHFQFISNGVLNCKRYPSEPLSSPTLPPLKRHCHASKSV